MASLPLAGCPVACKEPAGGAAGAASAVTSASAAPEALPPELAARVLARVGDRTITLGDYAAVLARMDRFERLRYQTADRRKALLNEIIQTELLAREAERRGLAEKPETRELVRLALRDELLHDLREGEVRPEAIPVSDVRAHYDAHRGEFREPERRRLSHIEVESAALAEKVRAEATGSSPTQWGELVRRHSLSKPAADTPVELLGDLGLVTSPAAGASDSARVAEPLRIAAFEIEAPGTVLGRVVEASGRFHVLRLTGKNAPRDRTFEEAERTIRVHLAQARLRKAEENLVKELRARFPVRIDEAALARVQVPAEEQKP